MISDEEWKLIEGYDYCVSTYGNIENMRTGLILQPDIRLIEVEINMLNYIKIMNEKSFIFID